jgi:Queuine tRNA-ribosyltransferase
VRDAAGDAAAAAEYISVECFVQLICLDHEIFHHLTPILTPSLTLTLTPMMPRTQALYGIIQGGIYEDLRDESTAFINQHAFFGTAIGGSLGASKKNMHDIVAYTRARVRDDRPVHLLGIGGVRDIFHGVRHGIDTFDCVHPSRLARHGGALGESSAVLYACLCLCLCLCDSRN